jgi:DNA-binding beta-propeller fold protein YncE
MNKLSVPKLLALVLLPIFTNSAYAGQAPLAAKAPDIAISSKDRVYLSDQSSNTVSVVNPLTEKLLGVIRLGDPTQLKPAV